MIVLANRIFEKYWATLDHSERQEVEDLYTVGTYWGKVMKGKIVVSSDIFWDFLDHIYYSYPRSAAHYGHPDMDTGQWRLHTRWAQARLWRH